MDMDVRLLVYDVLTSLQRCHAQGRAVGAPCLRPDALRLQTGVKRGRFVVGDAREAPVLDPVLLPHDLMPQGAGVGEVGGTGSAAYTYRSPEEAVLGAGMRVRMQETGTHDVHAAMILTAARMDGKAADIWGLGCLVAHAMRGTAVVHRGGYLVSVVQMLGRPQRDDVPYLTRLPAANSTRGPLAPALSFLLGRQAHGNQPGKPAVDHDRKQRRHASAKRLRRAVPLLSSAGLDFLAGCLAWNPADRWKVPEALAHPWLHGRGASDEIHVDVARTLGLWSEAQQDMLADPHASDVVADAGAADGDVVADAGAANGDARNADDDPDSRWTPSRRARASPSAARRKRQRALGIVPSSAAVAAANPPRRAATRGRADARRGAGGTMPATFAPVWFGEHARGAALPESPLLRRIAFEGRPTSGPQGRPRRTNAEQRHEVFARCSPGCQFTGQAVAAGRRDARASYTLHSTHCRVYKAGRRWVRMAQETCGPYSATRMRRSQRLHEGRPAVSVSSSATTTAGWQRRCTCHGRLHDRKGHSYKAKHASSCRHRRGRHRHPSRSSRHASRRDRRDRPDSTDRDDDYGGPLPAYLAGVPEPEVPHKGNRRRTPHRRYRDEGDPHKRTGDKARGSDGDVTRAVQRSKRYRSSAAPWLALAKRNSRERRGGTSTKGARVVQHPKAWGAPARPKNADALERARSAPIGGKPSGMKAPAAVAADPPRPPFFAGNLRHRIGPSRSPGAASYTPSLGLFGSPPRPPPAANDGHLSIPSPPRTPPLVPHAENRGASLSPGSSFELAALNVDELDAYLRGAARSDAPGEPKGQPRDDSTDEYALRPASQSKLEAVAAHLQDAFTLPPTPPRRPATTTSPHDQRRMSPPPQPSLQASMPPQRGTASSLPPQRGTAPSMPPQRGTPSSSPPQRGTASSMPSQRGTASSMPSQRGTASSMPSQQRGFEASPPSLAVAGELVLDDRMRGEGAHAREPQAQSIADTASLTAELRAMPSPPREVCSPLSDAGGVVQRQPFAVAAATREATGADGAEMALRRRGEGDASVVSATTVTGDTDGPVVADGHDAAPGSATDVPHVGLLGLPTAAGIRVRHVDGTGHEGSSNATATATAAAAAVDSLLSAASGLSLDLPGHRAGGPFATLERRRPPETLPTGHAPVPVPVAGDTMITLRVACFEVQLHESAYTQSLLGRHRHDTTPYPSLRVRVCVLQRQDALRTFQANGGGMKLLSSTAAVVGRRVPAVEDANGASVVAYSFEEVAHVPMSRTVLREWCHEGVSLVCQALAPARTVRVDPTQTAPGGGGEEVVVGVALVPLREAVEQGGEGWYTLQHGVFTVGRLRAGASSPALSLASKWHSREEAAAAAAEAVPKLAWQRLGETQSGAGAASLNRGQRKLARQTRKEHNKHITDRQRQVDAAARRGETIVVKARDRRGHETPLSPTTVSQHAHQWLSSLGVVLDGARRPTQRNAWAQGTAQRLQHQSIAHKLEGKLRTALAPLVDDTQS